MTSTLLIVAGLLLMLTPFLSHETDRVRGFFEARRNLRTAFLATEDDRQFAPLVHRIDRAERRHR